MMDLFGVLTEAARGRFPADDGAVDVLPSPAGPCDAVIAFTARSFVAAPVSDGWVRERLPADDLTGPMRADFLAALAEELGVKPGSLDVLLAAPAAKDTGNIELVDSETRDSRADRARLYRTEVRSYADRRGGAILNIGRGIAGRWDLSVELEPSRRSTGRGRELIEAARGLIPEDDFLFASIAPGNTRCLRACLAAGFTPLGAEVLFLTRLHLDPASIEPSR